MIYASGVVTFLSNNKNFKKYKRRTIALEVIEEIPAEDDSPAKTVCKYVALLPRSYECRSLEDYTGRVKPFLQKSISSIIVSVQVSHLNYASDRAVASIKKMN
ncbi:hypothetical protein JSQ81_19655 [Sporosarcina sp. Marseille-Q4063]|uniref:hypothetical protein n=1 Tax=Sporosarcina sp. Marseille-Q4063 TaxID=2810514 RepID=UPI001BAE6456|nr:hypothetical protein [Sporosarcina sp. Marseille-Q4063]QUW21956.1 hypothetical protein JSQ81_19655 [Sporosarcina sp. Marseille-Q4063]